VAWWEDFEAVDRLYVMIVLVVVNFSEDLVLDNLMFVRFYDFMCDN
jgi:hypothetical protein